jgi:hypothetical protein
VSGLDDLARLISGDEPPEWLLLALQTARETLGWSVRADVRFPGRKDLAKTLQVLEKATECIRLSIRDLDLSTMLLDGDPHFLNQNDMDRGLYDFARRVRLLNSQIPNRKGPDKFFGSRAGLGLRANCALMISLIWSRARGVWPPVNDKTAQEACAILWEKSGGDISKLYGKTKDAKSVSTWREHLRAAKAAGESSEALHL